MRHVGKAVPHVGGHVHDRAAMLLHRLGEDLAADDEAAGEIVAHHDVEALGAHGRGRRGELAAGIVEQAVDVAVGGDDLADRLLHLGLFADVEGVDLAGTARRFDLGLHGAEFLGLAAGDHDMGAQRRDFVRRAAADAAAAAGHDDGLALNSPGLKTERYDMFPPTALNGRLSACI
jgi:hypothetical protein